MARDAASDRASASAAYEVGAHGRLFEWQSAAGAVECRRRNSTGALRTQHGHAGARSAGPRINGTCKGCDAAGAKGSAKDRARLVFKKIR